MVSTVQRAERSHLPEGLPNASRVLMRCITSLLLSVSKYGSLIVRSGSLNPSSIWPQSAPLSLPRRPSICPRFAPLSLNLSAICPDQRTPGKIEDRSKDFGWWLWW